jgi:hypothetical protein
MPIDAHLPQIRERDKARQAPETASPLESCGGETISELFTEAERRLVSANRGSLRAFRSEGRSAALPSSNLAKTRTAAVSADPGRPLARPLHPGRPHKAALHHARPPPVDLARLESPLHRRARSLPRRFSSAVALLAAVTRAKLRPLPFHYHLHHAIGAHECRQ